MSPAPEVMAPTKFTMETVEFFYLPFLDIRLTRPSDSTLGRYMYVYLNLHTRLWILYIKDFSLFSHCLEFF